MARNDFKEIPLSPLTGAFDTRSPASDAGSGTYALVKNFSTRGARKRCRRGGWERLFAEVSSFNNQDLHDQLFAQQLYGSSTFGNYTGGGSLVDYIYFYTWPSLTVPSYNYVSFASNASCGYYPSANLTGTPDSSSCFTNRWALGFPYRYETKFYGACHGPAPNYYLYSYYYLDCPWTFSGYNYPSYGYGHPEGVYSPYFETNYSICTPAPLPLPGCNEAVTHLAEVSVEGSARKLVAATLSRIYALNQSSGNWKLLAAGLGSAAYTTAQCGCNDLRFTSATMGAYILLTNGFNEPLLWAVGDDSTESCEFPAKIIGDLDVLGLTAAGGAVSWKGFMIIYDVLENGLRHGGKIVWSDFEDPTSWIPGDTSVAGSATIAPGERFIAAAELGNFLLLYSDRSIWRVTLLDGDVIFSFDKIYSGSAALKYRYSLVNTGREHVYLGQNRIYTVTLFDTRPQEIDWLEKVGPVIFQGMNEIDAAFGPINTLHCDQVNAGWNETNKEVWISWPTGNETCPNVSLVLNMQYQAADLVDHGFTAFRSFRPDARPSIDGFMLDHQICSTQELIDGYFREGLPCAAVKSPTPITLPLTQAATSLSLWDVIVGTVDVIGDNNAGSTLYDLIPGNGLYIDLAGSPGAGTLRTKSSFTFTNGHTFELTAYLAGNQRLAATDTITITAGALLSANATLTNYLQKFTKYTFTFAGNGSTGKLTVGLTGGTQPLLSAIFGPLLGTVILKDNNTGSILFYDDFDSANPISPSTITTPGAVKSILNASESLALPPDNDSLCTRLANLTEDDFCRDCAIDNKFVMADASDLTLKQYRDSHFYRETFVGPYTPAYCGYACDNHYYTCSGYDSVLQSSAQDFSADAEKYIKRLSVEVDPLPQTTPNNLYCSVGYSSQGSCVTWVDLTPQPMKCLSSLSGQQLLDQGVRQDRRLHFPTFYRGHFLHWKLKVTGTGGGACFSQVVQVVKGGEANTSR